MNRLQGMRIIENVNLTEPGVVWLPAGRSGWKVKRIREVPYKGAIQVNANTLMMHPATVAALQAELERNIDWPHYIDGRV